MGEVAIVVDSLGKRYRLGQKQASYGTLRETVTGTLGAPLRWIKNLGSADCTDLMAQDGWIWALKDVSFKVHRGEVVGIIGRNGAGKSTFLKILSQITEPTEGSVEIHGRVASLLEVGTGFHAELTGRENVYLNGAILGMKKQEIESKFDEIVAFAEVEQFIDTPVKHYSSGMRLRLAFAVAAHLEPEILILDEVLAVGDAAFQKKCLGKMGDVAKEGRTVLFVSHNMAAITRLCGTAVQLEKGRLKRSGPSAEVVTAYLSSEVGMELKSSWSNEPAKPNHSEVQFKSARLLSIDEKPLSVTSFKESVLVEIAYDVKVPIRNLSVTCLLYDSMNNLVFESMDTDMPEWNGCVRDPDLYHATAKIPSFLLRPGHYQLSFAAFVEGVRVIERLERALAFDVSGVGYTLQLKRNGIVSPVLDWKVRRFNENGRMT